MSYLLYVEPNICENTLLFKKKFNNIRFTTLLASSNRIEIILDFMKGFNDKMSTCLHVLTFITNMDVPFLLPFKVH